MPQPFPSEKLQTPQAGDDVLRTGSGAAEQEVVARRQAEGVAGLADASLNEKLPDKDLSIDSAPPIVREVVRSGGQHLGPEMRGRMEPHFAADFGDVAIHTDRKAAESALAVDARAFTVGRHIVFGSGQYAPGTPHGTLLLAHELAHVVQQRYRGLSLQRDSRSEKTSGASGAALSLDWLQKFLQETGFTPAGPDAIGIVAFPSLSRQHPAIPENLDIWGHTAVYVRLKGKIVAVRGFNVQSLLELLGKWTPVKSGAASVRAEYTDDAALFTHTGARAIEYPVTGETAKALAQALPAPGPAAAGERWTGVPGNYSGPTCEGSNCVLWAIRQIQARLGGLVGGKSSGASVADLGKNAIAKNTASQGRLIRLLDALRKGKEAPIEVPHAIRPPVSSRMPIPARAGIWAGRGFNVLAPILEWISNSRANLPTSQNLMRTGTLIAGMRALGSLYGGGEALKVLGPRSPALKPGTRAGGGVDLLVNLVNLGAQLLGAPKPVTALTETAATLTPSNTILSGARSFVDFAHGAFQGTEGLERVHQSQAHGESGGMIQGYALMGGVIGGEDLDWLTSTEAARGDYGIFVESGNYWGDVASGQRSLTHDLGEIWDEISRPITFDQLREWAEVQKLMDGD